MREVSLSLNFHSLAIIKYSDDEESQEISNKLAWTFQKSHTIRLTNTVCAITY